MDNLKERMYDFEVTPPDGVWDSISAELDGGSVVPITKKTPGKKLYFIIAAAACIAALIFSGIWFFTSNKNETKEFSSAPINKTENENVISEEKPESNTRITAPHTIKKINTDKNNTEVLVKKSTKKESDQLPNNSAVEKNNDIVTDENKSYITVAGPEGQPVKVSSKVASLIESSDNSYPPKPVWNKKINKWKDIMKANTLTPTTGNFLDIVDLTNSLQSK
jgi:FtsZ-interacting cell division protein ZipA